VRAYSLIQQNVVVSVEHNTTQIPVLSFWEPLTKYHFIGAIINASSGISQGLVANRPPRV